MSAFMHFETMSSDLDNQYQEYCYQFHTLQKNGPLAPIPEEPPEELAMCCQGDRWRNVIAKGLPCMPKRSRSLGNKHNEDSSGCGDSVSSESSDCSEGDL